MLYASGLCISLSLYSKFCSFFQPPFRLWRFVNIQLSLCVDCTSRHSVTHSHTHTHTSDRPWEGTAWHPNSTQGNVSGRVNTRASIASKHTTCVHIGMYSTLRHRHTHVHTPAHLHTPHTHIRLRATELACTRTLAAIIRSPYLKIRGKSRKQSIFKGREGEVGGEKGSEYDGGKGEGFPLEECEWRMEWAGRKKEKVRRKSLMCCDAPLADLALPPLIYPDRLLRFILCWLCGFCALTNNRPITCWASHCSTVLDTLGCSSLPRVLQLTQRSCSRELGAKSRGRLSATPPSEGLVMLGCSATV